jgi:hypothetical protein
MIENAIRRQAAVQGIPEGTLVDSLVWKALVEPDEAKLKAGGFTEEELERTFAEQVLAILENEETIPLLFDVISLEDKEGNVVKGIARRRVEELLVKRWRTTRMIDKEYQENVVQYLSDIGVVPKILLHKMVDEEWFTP